jgi:hypothetical protein
MKTIQQTTQELSSDIRWLRNEMVHLQLLVHGFTPDDPDPYGTYVENYNRLLMQLDQDIFQIQQRYVKFQEEIRFLSDLPFLKKIYFFMKWKELHDDIISASLQMPSLHEQVSSIKLTAVQLSNFGWEVGTQCRTLMATINDAKNRYDLLSEACVEDEVKEKVFTRLEEWETTLRSSIPAVFFSTDRDLVINQADKVDTARAYRIIQGADIDIKRLSQLLDRWLSYWKVIEKLIPELENDFSDITQKMDSSRDYPLCPISWTETATQINQCKDQFLQIYPLEKQRLVNDVEKNAKDLEVIRARVITISEKVDRILENRDRLVGLWSSVTLVNGADWAVRAKEFCEEIKEYHPSNFNKKMMPDDLLEDLNRMVDLHQRNVHSQIVAGIRETNIPAYLKTSEELMNYHESLQPKLSFLQDRYRELQAIIQEKLESAQQNKILLNQLGSLCKLNAFLMKVASKDLTRLQKDIEQIIVRLEHPHHENISRLVEKSQKLMGKISDQANRWLIALEDDVIKRKSSLAKDYQKITESVCLDEPAFVDIDRLIKAEINDLKGRLPQVEVKFPLFEAVNLIRSENDVWQRCVAAEKAMDEITGAVLERYRSAEKNRQSMVYWYEKMDKLLPEILDWPPSTQNINKERYQIIDMEKQWMAIKHEKNRALTLVGKLSDISNQYQGLVAQFSTIHDKTRQEHQRISQYEERLQESKRLWQQQVSRYQGNRILADSVSQFIDEVDQDFSTLKIRYKKNSLNYNQALQNLRGICRKLDDALMPIDQTQVIDINGVSQKKRF